VPFKQNSSSRAAVVAAATAVAQSRGPSAFLCSDCAVVGPNSIGMCCRSRVEKLQALDPVLQSFAFTISGARWCVEGPCCSDHRIEPAPGLGGRGMYADGAARRNTPRCPRAHATPLQRSWSA
jgi:hypothetical protein